MKRNGLLFSLVSLMCVSLVAGCDDAKYSIGTSVQSNEFGMIEGGGDYSKGATVNLKIYPNVGCTVKSLLFAKAGEDVTVEGKAVNGLGSSLDGTHSNYEFLVGDETIGNYYATFDCPVRGSDELVQSKTKVIYRLYNSTDDEITAEHYANRVILVDNTGTTEKDQSGKLLKHNEQLVLNGGLIEPILYHEKIDGRIVWHYKESPNDGIFDTVFDFSQPVRGRQIELYGKILKWNDNTQILVDKGEGEEPEKITISVSDLILKEALDSFKNYSDVITIRYGEDVNNNDILDVDDETTDDVVEDEFTELAYVQNAGKTDKEIYINLMKDLLGKGLKTVSALEKNKYYELIDVKDDDSTGNLTDNKLGVLNLGVDGTNIDIKSINKLYKFIQLRDVLYEDYDLQLSGSKADLKDVKIAVDYDQETNSEIFSSVKCFWFKSKNADAYIQEIYVYNGKIYKLITKDNQIMEMKYSGVVAGIANNYSDMYISRMYSNNAQLNSYLNEFNDDFEKIIKITPKYNKNLNYYLDGKLHEELKKYDYSIRTSYSEKDDVITCGESLYNTNSFVSTNLKLCLQVEKGGIFSNVQSALEKLENKEVTTSINIFGDTEPVIRVGKLEGKLSDWVVEEGSINGVIWSTLNYMKNVYNDQDYYRFDYIKDGDDYKYQFYRKNQSVPYLTVILNGTMKDDGTIENCVLKSVSYYDNNNTYVSTFKDIEPVGE